MCTSLGYLKDIQREGLAANRQIAIGFVSWSDAEEELELKPISAPDGPSPAEEDEEDLAGFFSVFD